MDHKKEIESHSKIKKYIYQGFFSFLLRNSTANNQRSVLSKPIVSKISHKVSVTINGNKFQLVWLPTKLYVSWRSKLAKWVEGRNKFFFLLLFFLEKRGVLYLRWKILESLQDLQNLDKTLNFFWKDFDHAHKWISYPLYLINVWTGRQTSILAFLGVLNWYDFFTQIQYRWEYSLEHYYVKYLL